ncbi:hypothetical protein D4764_09G0000880 [Takifugu flavidus]|uniref:Reverse transcriptase domain-containing protein n=1 Tax=Takifugu flavidus TaxID=433684 RepID=A0A5C6MJS7_9TELE|nr:hypothetical protein D4764_09G0000880 [Takifugu flavidus]
MEIRPIQFRIQFRIRFGDLRIGSLLFADDVVLWASSAHDLQLSLGPSTSGSCSRVREEWSRRSTAYRCRRRSIFVPSLTYGHELWVMTERTRSRVQVAKMSFLRRVAGLSLRDRVRSSAIREELGVEPLLLRVERSQMRWLGHLVRMPPGRLPGDVFRACPSGRRPPGRPRTRWRVSMSLDWSGNAWGSLRMSWKK